jgi:hypothetical protein
MRPWRRLLVAGIAVAVAAVVVALTASGGHKSATRPAQTTSRTQPPPPGPRPQGQQLGASVNILFNTPGAFSSAQIDAQLRALQATGATIARSDALWETIEPAAPSAGIHHYLWGFDDRIAGSLAAHGLEWLPIVDYSAPWAATPSGRAHSPPSSPADYAAFGAALAARYGPGGSFWRSHPALPATPVHAYEIWNEPDNPTFWSPAPDPASYGELYLQARTAIHAVDPGARVIIGGLTHPEAFLPPVIAAVPPVREEVDGIAIHSYAGTPDAVLGRVREARKVLDGLGLTRVPLYITEFGWTTSPPHALNWAPPSERAGDIGRTFTALGHTDCNVAAAILYTWVTLEQNPANREDWYGISPRAGGDSADTVAFAAGLHDASAPGPQLRTCSGLP